MCTCACVRLRGGQGIRAGHSGRAFRQEGEGTLYSLQIFDQLPLRTPCQQGSAVCIAGDVFSEILCEEKVRNGEAVAPALPVHPTSFIPFHTTRGVETFL